MENVVVVGAGKIGSVIANLLAETGDYRILLADKEIDTKIQQSIHYPIDYQHLDVTDEKSLSNILKGQFAVINALPYQYTESVAKSAASNNVHYLDLTEDVAATKLVKSYAEGARSAFIPQCGLAPGFISIAANHIASQFDKINDLHLRVGALPLYPTNALKYNLTWSTDGLLNEYCRPCEAIANGKLIQTLALEELETFTLDGDRYEAFNTSGGLGSLCETLLGKVENLNYRSVRYPGHRDIMKLLLQDLRLKDDQELLKQVFERALPRTLQDVVVIFISATGYSKGSFLQKCYVNKIYGRQFNGQLLGAIQITTAASICAVLDMLVKGEIPQSGFICQEDISFSKFIKNRFGEAYAGKAAGD